MGTVIWCGKKRLNNCGPHFTEPVFGVKRFEENKKNTNELRKQDNKRTFEDFLKEAMQKKQSISKENTMNKKIDERLSKIADLKWLPWIGKHYSKRQCKVMVLGESHYCCAGDNPKEYGQNFTRDFIGMHQRGEEGTPVIRNFEKTLLDRDTDEEVTENERLSITDSIVYQVAVQRLLNSSKERPKGADFTAGIKAVLDTIKILEPNTIISLGVKAFDVLMHLKCEELILKKEKWADAKINNSYPRYCKIELDGKPIDVIGLRHTSGTMGGYYPKEWYKFLKKHFKIADFLKETGIS